MGYHFLYRGLSCAFLLSLLIGCADSTDDTSPMPSPDTTSTDANEADGLEEVQPDIGATTISVISDGDSYLCIPAGVGPFPGVLYNHGGLGDAIGGDLEATCQALAEAGYVGYSKQRRLTTPIVGHIDDVYEGLDALLTSDQVDPERIAIMGFSRGGFLSLQAATEKPEVFDAIVLMAPASVNGALETMSEDLSMIAAPVLVLVSENDLFQDDHVYLVEVVVAGLEAAGKEVTHNLYPPFGGDGHTRFFEVGDYWVDVLNFLDPLLTE